MMFGLEPFKAFASTPIENVIIAMNPQMNMNGFVQFQIVEPKNRLIIFSIFTNDSNIEIVSKKRKLGNLPLRLIPLNLSYSELFLCAEFDPVQKISYFQK